MTNRKADFPIFANHPGLHYLDSAATAQKPRAVLDAERAFYETSYANPHRGAYALSVAATEAYHGARDTVATFFGVADPACLIFTRGTTEGLNLVAGAWGRAHLTAGDEVVVTRLEHHANFVPWQQVARERGAAFRICELTEHGEVDLAQLERLVGPRTKVVSFTHVSNALGTINPVREIVELVRRRSSGAALTVLDGAQSAPHLPVAFDTLGVDFYAFSGHKMGAPTGIGGLIGRRDALEATPPWQTGGDMIEFVHDDHTTWNVLPHRLEAGTPNAGGAVGLAAACDYLSAVGMAEVRRHERALVELAHRRLLEIEGVRVFGPPAGAADRRSGVVSFAVADIHPHDLATVLDQDGVCVRAGHHCCQPLMRSMGVAATARASFYLYNDESDVDALAAGIVKARELFGCAV